MSDLAHAERLLRGRRSVRQFTAAPVDRALIERVLAAAAWAPSPGNRQGWSFTVVTSPAARRQMAAAVRERWRLLLAREPDGAVAEELGAYARNFDWFDSAPVVIAVSAREPEAFLSHLLGPRAAEVSGGPTAAAMAAQNLMLAAHAAGLGSCCLTGPLAAAEEIQRLLGLPSRQRLVCLVAMGHPAGEPEPPARRPVAAAVRFVE